MALRSRVVVHSVGLYIRVVLLFCQRHQSNVHCHRMHNRHMIHRQLPNLYYLLWYTVNNPTELCDHVRHVWYRTFYFKLACLLHALGLYFFLEDFVGIHVFLYAASISTLIENVSLDMAINL